jgi:hypothetical protein
MEKLYTKELRKKIYSLIFDIDCGRDVSSDKARSEAADKITDLFKEEVIRLLNEQKKSCFYEWTNVEQINFTNKVKDAILNAPYPEEITKTEDK